MSWKGSDALLHINEFFFFLFFLVILYVDVNIDRKLHCSARKKVKLSCVLSWVTFSFRLPVVKMSSAKLFEFVSLKSGEDLF